MSAIKTPCHFFPHLHARWQLLQRLSLPRRLNLAVLWPRADPAQTDFIFVSDFGPVQQPNRVFISGQTKLYSPKWSVIFTHHQIARFPVKRLKTSSFFIKAKHYTRNFHRILYLVWGAYKLDVLICKTGTIDRKRDGKCIVLLRFLKIPYMPSNYG